MTLSIVRIFCFTILPLLVAWVQSILDRSTNTRERRIELFLIYLFALGVAGSGIGGFFSHFFISDVVAESIGWPAGNPFQLEVAFANLAVGVLGLIAVGRRDGFREATVIAETGNLAPGNTWQNVANLLRPAFLIAFLAASRRAEKSPQSETNSPEFDTWRSPRLLGAGLMTASVATGFGAGFALNLVLIGTLVGVIVGCILVAYVLYRAGRVNG
jgi:hypothetical protein